MNLDAVFTAIRARLATDTGSGGLFYTGGALVTGTYSQIAVPGLSASYPYLYLDLASVEPLDGFALNHYRIRFRVHTFAAASGGYTVVDQIRVRIYGSGGRTPGYGLHRHLLVLASGGWTATAIRYVDTQFNNTPDYYQAVDIFEFNMSAASS